MQEQQAHLTTWRSAAASVPCATLFLREAGSLKDIALSAARSGQAHVLDWSRLDGYKCDIVLFREAAVNGQLDAFEWADAEGLVWNSHDIDYHAAWEIWNCQNGCGPIRWNNWRLWLNENGLPPTVADELHELGALKIEDVVRLIDSFEHFVGGLSAAPYPMSSKGQGSRGPCPYPRKRI
jgi:hypothetical protein